MISASLVTYHNPRADIKSVIDTFLNSSIESVLFVSDNSSNRDLEELCSSERIVYIFNDKNLGFGAAHNIAIREAFKLKSKFHLILNPDVKFDSDIIEILVTKMSSDSNIGALMPKVLNLDQSVQYLPKLLPSPFRLIIRLIVPLRRIFSKQYRQYVLVNYEDFELNVPMLSGCFSIYNMKALKEVGLFDEKFFMYFEDNDLSRRIHKNYKTLYFPTVSILHGYERGATKNFRLFRIYIKSAIKYFNIYGWFFDRERRKINEITLKQLGSINR